MILWLRRSKQHSCHSGERDTLWWVLIKVFKLWNEERKLFFFFFPTCHIISCQTSLLLFIHHQTQWPALNMNTPKSMNYHTHLSLSTLFQSFGWMVMPFPASLLWPNLRNPLIHVVLSWLMPLPCRLWTGFQVRLSWRLVNRMSIRLCGGGRRLYGDEGKY